MSGYGPPASVWQAPYLVMNSALLPSVSFAAPLMVSANGMVVGDDGKFSLALALAVLGIVF